MSEERSKGGWPNVVGVVVLVLVLGAIGLYAWGYFAMCTSFSPTFTPTPTPGSYKRQHVRMYDSQRKAVLFYPASKIESLVLREPVIVGY